MKYLKELTDAKIESGRKANPEFMKGVDAIIDEAKAFQQGNDAIKIGKKAPLFELPNAEGKKVSLEGLLNEGPLVVTFYRGNWCPFCMAQVEEMVNNYKAISEMGADVIFVGSQSGEKNAALSKKFAIEAKFLTDPNREYAEGIGLLDEGGLPLGLEILGYEKGVYRPAVIVTDGSGVIRYLDITDNYRLRPEPQEFLTILKGI